MKQPSSKCITTITDNSGVPKRSLPPTPASTGGTNTPSLTLERASSSASLNLDLADGIAEGGRRSQSYEYTERGEEAQQLRKRSAHQHSNSITQLPQVAKGELDTSDRSTATDSTTIPTINPLRSQPDLTPTPSPKPSLIGLIMSLFGAKPKKYSSLPSSSSDTISGSSSSDPYGPSSPSRRRTSSTGAKYRKYFLLVIVAFVGLLLLAGGGRSVGRSIGLLGDGTGGSGKESEFALQEGEFEEAYYGEEDGLEGGWPADKVPSGFAAEEEDPEAFASPPFLGKPASDLKSEEEEDDEDEEESQDFHILPAGGLGRPTRPSSSTTNADEADFAELDAEEQDDLVPPVKGGKGVVKGGKGKGAVAHSEEDDLDAAPEADFDDVTESVADASLESKGPTSFETDPDPSGTTFCTKPHTEGSKIVQYALTIDAGSTGSRIHAYKFNNCGPSPSLEYETFLAVNPGLSSFKNDPTAAAASLDPLMKEALRVVPEELRSCTPVEVKATAGLRLLDGSQGQAILDEVRQRLETDWPFALGREESAVEIMDGKDEGVYAWITANYLLGRIGAGTSGADSMAVMDLGGASTQIVFEPNFPADSGLALAEGDHKYALTFGGRDFTLYQHSYLGYGLMRARRSVNNLVAFTWSFLQPGGSTNIEWDDLDEEVDIPNPCLSKSTRRRVELDPPGRKSVNVTMVGAESGFEACNRVVQLVMAKDAVCEVKPCSFNGVYQPSLLETFPSGQLLALSYFTDRIQPLIKPFRRSKTGIEAQTLTIDTVATMAKAVCAGPTSWKKTWGKDKEAMFELEDRPEYCLDLTFMHALLGLGYELGGERELVVEKKLRGVELGWALGAGIAMVEKSTLVCTL